MTRLLILMLAFRISAAFVEPCYEAVSTFVNDRQFLRGGLFSWFTMGLCFTFVVQLSVQIVTWIELTGWISSAMLRALVFSAMRKFDLLGVA